MSQKDEMTAEKVDDLLRQGQAPHIIDVREDEEVAGGMIPTAKHISMGEVPERLDEFSEDDEYIIVCRSGNRSGRVTEFLRSQGIEAKNMTGGMLSWTGNVSSDDQPPRASNE